MLILLSEYVTIVVLGHIPTSNLEEVFELFGKEIDYIYVIAQVLGFAAMTLGILSYQSKRRSRIIIMQTASNAILVLQYIMLGAYSAVVANAIGIVRNIVYVFRGKYKFADSIAIPIVCSVAFIISGIFTYETPFDILPVFAMVIASFAFFMTSGRMIRLLSIFIALSWIIFNVYAGSIAGVLSDAFTLVSVIISIIRYRSVEKYSKDKTDGL